MGGFKVKKKKAHKPTGAKRPKTGPYSKASAKKRQAFSKSLRKR